jgi:hypothetical protein
MGRIRSQLRFGLWPGSPTSTHHPAELTIAAKRLAESVIRQLRGFGVTVGLDKAGRAHFGPTRIPSRDARLLAEAHADLIESFLRERALQEEQL